MLYFPKLSKFPKKQKRKNCKRQNHALRRKEKGDNVCLRLVKQEQNFCIAVRDWKPVLRRSASSLRFSAALGIARTSSDLRSLARKFLAHRAVLVDPDTSCPVTVAALRSALQAPSTNHALRKAWKSDNVCLRYTK